MNYALEITSIKIDFKGAYGNVLAFATVIFSDTLEVEFAIVQGKKHIFVSLPSGKRNKNDSFHKILKIVSKQFYFHFQKIVINYYNSKIVEIAENSQISDLSAKK